MLDIRLDYDVLRGAATNLDTVASQLEASDDTSAAAAEASGHERLAGELREFAGNWDDTRRRFARAAADLAAKLDDIREAFEALDYEGMGD